MANKTKYSVNFVGPFYHFFLTTCLFLGIYKLQKSTIIMNPSCARSSIRDTFIMLLTFPHHRLNYTLSTKSIITCYYYFEILKEVVRISKRINS